MIPGKTIFYFKIAGNYTALKLRMSNYVDVLVQSNSFFTYSINF